MPAGESSSVTVALIAALGTVLVAVIGLIAQWLSRSPKSTVTLPAPDPQIGERVAVALDRVETGRRTLDQLDRYLHGVDDEVEKLRWDVDDLKAWRDEHRRRHGDQP